MRHAAELAPRLDDATKPFRLLEHPFYRAWAAGTLTHDDLSHYAAQYFRQVEAFPEWLEALADRVDGEAERILRDNLADERDGNHSGLWLQFAEALGVDSEAVRRAAPEPETQRSIDAFGDAAASHSPTFALGMLYGYESQTPGVAATKVEGLRTHYSIDGPGIEYFELHGELDVEHASEMARAIAGICETDDDVAEAVAGARAGAEAVWGLLDGVTRARSISC